MTFMEQYIEETTEHPLIRRQRVWRNAVTLEVYPFSSKMHIASIYSLYPGAGNASRCLDWLIKLALTRGVELEGTAKRFGRQGIPTPQLRAWYKRHGARFERNSYSFTFPQWRVDTSLMPD